MVNDIGEGFLITLREGFEAGLIVAIVLAVVRANGRPELRRWVWLGTGAALALAAVAGVALHLTVEELTGTARLHAFAGVCLAAACVLTWMIFWMRRQARSLRSELELRVGAAMRRSALALAAVAFLAVAREGLETALFLVSTAGADGGSRIAIGGAAGLAAAAALAVAAYHGTRVIPMRVFFQATGVMIIALAAGLLSRAVQLLQAAGDLGTVNGAAYDLTMHRWLTVDSEVGRFLAGILGWDPRPSAEQVLVYCLFAAGALWLFLRRGGSSPHRPRAGPEAAGA
jgi:high-affinity iron transporter